MHPDASRPQLLIRPPAAESFPRPPTTLSGLTAYLSAITRIPSRGTDLTHDDKRSARTLLNRLAQAAVDHDSLHYVSRQALSPAILQVLLDALTARPSRLKLSLSCRIGRSTDTPPVVPPGTDAIVQVRWQATERLPDLGFFKGASRAGIWNHLVLSGPAASLANRDTIARQPNIIHSWRVDSDGGPDTDPDDGYGGLAPLPGHPLWQMVDDPVHRFVLVDRFGKNWLLRSRVDVPNDRILTLGDNLAYHFCSPDRLPEGYLDTICAMVAAGGTVATTHVRTNLERAYLIGYVLENDVIVGNSSLKHPRPQYIENVRRQSGLDLSGFVERGYTSVRPEYRGLGIGTRLLEGLTARVGDRKLFSVIAEDNEATKIIARRNRTRQVAGYYSEKAGKSVGVWMPEWMIDSHVKTHT